MDKIDLIPLQKEVTHLRAEGKYKETIEASFKLFDLGMTINDYKSVLTALVNQAASYYCIGDIEAAFLSMESFEELCHKYGDVEDQVNLYNILFLLFEVKKDVDKGILTLQKSIELGDQIKKFNIVSNAYSNMSHLFILEENYVDALKMSKIGLEKAKLHQPPSPILELRVTLNIAKSYIGLKDFENSKRLIDEIMNDPLLDSFIREKAQCHDLLAFWYLKQDLYREAFEAYTTAKTLVESYDDIYLLKVIQEERCKLCDLLNDFQVGYTVQKEYIAVLNEINKKELELKALKLEVKQSLNRLEKKANTDYLTGLYNRSYLEETTNKWLIEASEKDQQVICIVFDIDNFKLINDKFGHVFGDEMIKQVSQACLTTFKEDDLIGRYGGDEFVVILKNVNMVIGQKKAEQILETLRNFKIIKDETMISITASIGVAHNSNMKSHLFNELFHLADMALYKAKESGKNKVYVSVE
ncbi:MAG: GGDEF domain-containing protein [Paenisporosarcina sp.]